MCRLYAFFLNACFLSIKVTKFFMIGTALPYSDLLGSFRNEIGLISWAIASGTSRMSKLTHYFPNNQSILTSLLRILFNHKKFLIRSNDNIDNKSESIYQKPLG